MRAAILTTLLLLLGHAPAAHADESCPSDYWDSCKAFDDQGLELGFASVYAPEINVGTTRLDGVGMGVGASFRVQRLSAGVEYGALFASATNGEPASMHRVGVVARYLTESPPVSKMRRRGLFFEAGAGREFLSWDTGDLSRFDFMVGVGGHTTLAIGRHYVGMYVGLRALLAQRPATATNAGGPSATFLASFGGMFHFDTGGGR